ncbi:MAG TPA: Ig-like domain-containing protein [Solirubrobacteraceae bacterium]|nr:Ig-like domain-containing protein [Solirubrobacteraceae bacterium]
MGGFRGTSARSARISAAFVALTFALIAAVGMARGATATALPGSPLATTPVGDVFGPFATRVSGLSATASSSSAGASQVVYTADFTATTELAASSGYVQLTAPAGARFNANGASYEVIDTTSEKEAQSDRVVVSPGEAGENVVEVYVPGTFSIAAGDAVEVESYGVGNPTSEAPSAEFFLSTSADTEAVSTSFPIGPETSVTNVSATASTTSAGASEVVYTASLKLSSALSNGNAEQFGDNEQPGFVRLQGPSGTVFSPDGYSYEVIDGARQAQAVHVEVDPEGRGENVVDVDIPPYFATPVKAGETLEIEAYGARNPSSPVPGGEVLLSTSSDLTPVAQPLAIGGETQIGDLQAEANTTSAGATRALYTVSFKTASALTNGDASDFGDEEKPGRIRLTAPAGTIFDSDGYSYEVGDAREHEQAVHVKVDPEGNGETNVVEVDVSPYFSANVAAGETVTIEAYGVENPASEDPTGRLTVSTTSDVTPASTRLPIGAATKVNEASIGSLAGDYTVKFASPSNVSNGDPEQFGDDEQPGFLTLVAANGATLPDEARYYGFKVRSVQGGTTEYGVLHLEVHGQTATVYTYQDIPAGSQVELTIEDVTGSLSSALLSTSSDASPVSVGASALAPLSGTVSFAGQPEVGAEVQACETAGGECQTTTTEADGAFKLAVPADAGATYALTANPPGASSHAGQGRLAPVVLGAGAAGATGLEIVLGKAPGIAAGVGILTPAGEEQTSSTPNPFVPWTSPYELSLEPSFFPEAGRILVTKVVVHGTNAATGEPEQQVVDAGGEVGGLPLGLPLGGGPLTIDMPSDYPMHGEVQTTIDYRVERGHRAQAAGVAATNVLDETYPSSGTPARDPVAAYFLNYGDAAGISVGTARIVGPDARYFQIVSLGSAGSPRTSTDCGASAAQLSAFAGQGTPPAGTECGIAVQFTPPGEGEAHRIYYHAKLRVSTGAPGASSIPVALLGCDARVARATGSVCYRSAGAGIREEAGEETPFNSRQLLEALEEELKELEEGKKECLVYVGGSMVPRHEPEPCLAAASSESAGGSVEIEEEEEEEEEEGEEEGGGGGSYHDPSGVVYTQTAEGAVPLAGATVTLRQSYAEAGPFAAVPNESTIMSPANRTNPGLTDAEGLFGWDVLAGFYEIEAAKSGCTPATTPMLTVPPPVESLSLTLTCTSPPARGAPTASVSASSPSSDYGQPVTFTARVEAGSDPTGTVVFDDGSTPIGEAVLREAGGRREATLTLGDLTPGEHPITARYGGDGANKPATSAAIDHTVNGPAGTQEEPHGEQPHSQEQGGGGSGGGSNGGGSSLGTSPPPTTASAVCKAALTRAQLSATAGAVAIELRGTGAGTCTGTLTLSVRRRVGRGRHARTGRQRIGTARFTLAAGRTTTVRLTLDPAGRALLKRGHGHVQASLELMQSTANVAMASLIPVTLVEGRPARRGRSRMREDADRHRGIRRMPRRSMLGTV